MVYAVLEDSSVHLIDNWRMAKFEKKITKMVLMDGNKMVYELSGYDQYLVETEKVITTSGHNPVSRETVYGLHDYSDNKKVLLKDYEDSLKRIYAKYTDKEDVTKRVNRVKAAYGRMLKSIEDREVAFISMFVTEGQESSVELNTRMHLVPSDIKKGLGVKHDNKKLLGKRYLGQF
jgi:hypothetical protein